MADEESRDEEQAPDEAPADQAEAPAQEAEAPAEEAEAREEEAEAPAEEAESADVEDAPAGDEGEAEETSGRRRDPAADEVAAEPAEKPKAKDTPPGAELEPIALEPERELSAEERARAEAEAEERARLEAEADARTGPRSRVARSGPTVELAADARIQATGKRKSAIARVVLRPGSGAFEVNSRKLEEYFPRHQHQAYGAASRS